MMDVDYRQAAQDLVDALRSALVVADLQEKQVEATRAMADNTQRLLKQLTQAPESAPPSGARESLLDTVRSSRSVASVQEDTRLTLELGLRWETAFCDVYEALIRLNAYPEVRAEVKEIAATIRSLRLLSAEAPDPDPPASTPAPSPGLTSAAEPGSAGARSPGRSSQTDRSPDARAARQEMLLRFMQESDAQHQQVQSAADTTAERVRAYLREALARAEALL